ncbi:MAG: ATP-dependent DNA helicase RecG [Rhizobiales bacterium 65-9]|nr:ATP-dependent DNA helicase RecG [Hyphomicrobiales bacterium]OJY35431.1 MAG: ATP-dependent DNA helicase RecG [Rhizobiales bacterium 65-9]
MRPAILNSLFASVTGLPGVGPKLGRLFDRLLSEQGREARLRDILFHPPSSAVDRSLSPDLRSAPVGGVATVALRVEDHQPPARRGRAPYRVLCSDHAGQDVMLIFFHGREEQISKMLPLGATRWVSGKLELWDGRLQMVHPDRVLDERGFAAMPRLEPVYPATDGLPQRVIAKAARAALDRVPDLPEWQDQTLLARERFPSFRSALEALHQPDGANALDPMQPARRRLAYDELLASQLALALVRASVREIGGRSQRGDGRLSQRIRDALPYALTGSQTQAVAEINADLAADKRMMRLLQGDVGSGKTIVGLLAMATVVEAGRQAAMMAPTEILARQHHQRIAPLAEAAGLRAALMTGRDRASAREKTRKALAAGDIDIVVGTHAIFQEDVAFRDLGLAVVDEQHRFGVHQRMTLGAKGDAVDVLAMTATPIPRTLVLTFFGDIDISVLREKPAGRQPIDTRAIDLDRLGEVVEAVGRAMRSGAQVYWVCPLVAESEALDVAAAEERHETLKQHFGGAVELLHGQMKGAAKEEAMARFARGDARILVATTVIEVGVDVPNASLMVIEHAERFGLAQLHQLRGRVGRGAARSACLLLYKGPLGETAKARLSIMRETDDGFRIAEEDLRLRGEGDILGRRQSGMPGFRLARPDIDADLLATARDDAKLIMARDPQLRGERGEALRILLYLFERDEAVRLMRAG